MIQSRMTRLTLTDSIVSFTNYQQFMPIFFLLDVTKYFRSVCVFNLIALEMPFTLVGCPT